MTRELPKRILVLALVLLGFVASGTALAQRYAGPGHFYGGPVHFGFYLGVPIYGPPFYSPYYAPYYPPPYYYPPATVVPYAAPAYVEQVNALSAPAQPPGDWFYCPAAKAYYPYARECPAGWQRVPAQPPAR